jgi:hypothetical protein
MKRAPAWGLLMVSICVCIATWCGIAAAESEEAGLELQTYFSNANTTGGLANVNVTLPLEGVSTCAMIYVFDTHQNLQVCCGCPITNDGLLTLNVSGNLAPNPVGSTSILSDGSIRIVSADFNDPSMSHFAGENCLPNSTLCCDPSARFNGNRLSFNGELVAWATHVQASQITESEFVVKIPVSAGVCAGAAPSVACFDGTVEGSGDPGELPEACADIIQLGSGAGVCTCPSEGRTTGPT